MIDDLLAAMREAVAELTRWPGREVLLCHHNDSDGLSSAAILTRAFARRRFVVQRVCLEKPYPEVLQRLLDRTQPPRLIIFADFAGRIAPLISDLNRGHSLVLILDHHKARRASDRRV